jgi:siroheme synthase-like protein
LRLPTVLNIDGPVIIFGGGNVGLRKVEYLSKFSEDITLVTENAPSLPVGIKLKQVKVQEDAIAEYIPKGTALVVSAFSSRELNHAISRWCTENGILVNVVDDPEVSTILFPALSTSGDLNIAVSTSGRCPFLARKIREELDEGIEIKGIWLEVLSPIRDELVEHDKKNEILNSIYSDNDLNQLVKNGDLEGAKRRALEVYNVCREH